MALAGRGLDAGKVAHVASTVELRVGVENLFVPAALGDAQTVFVPHDRREVARHEDKVVGISRPPQIHQHAVVVIVAVDPVEALPLEIDLVQRQLASVEGVQIRH